MTTIEFSNEFDILYDSIASLGAPDLDEYEKSVFLTKAQLEIVKEVNGDQNKYGTSFEGSDKRRADLRALVVNYTVAPTATTTGLSSNSYTATLPSKVFLIKFEVGWYTPVGCTDKASMEIIPLKYDEYHDKTRNPFRKPDYRNGFRLDIESSNGSKVVELLADRPIDSYQIRYIKYPKPIVLSDLDAIQTGLSIDGAKSVTECELDEELHREILDRSVQLAMLAYKPESLQMKAQLDQRNN